MNETSDIGKMFSQLTSSIGGGVTDMFNKLKNSSIGEQFQSWIGKGENKPVTADQVTDALGPDALNKMAEKTGTTPEQAAQNVAQKLPGMVDKITPDGQLPDAQTIKANLANAATAAKPKATAAGSMTDTTPPTRS
jgi:uncharacterized protein YidB (DUF937 family)